MPLTPRPFAPAHPHGELIEVLPDLFFVTGTMKMPGPMRFSRNMTVVRQGGSLILVNTVRLNDAGLAALEKLGKVTDVIRIAGNHGLDDPFYADRSRVAKEVQATRRSAARTRGPRVRKRADRTRRCGDRQWRRSLSSRDRERYALITGQRRSTGVRSESASSSGVPR